MKKRSLLVMLALSSLLTAKAQIFSVGMDHGIMICNGVVKSWGMNDNGQLGNGIYNSNMTVQNVNITNVVAVGASKSSSIALKNDGTVWTWGDNLHGVLGIGSAVADTNTPVQVSGLSGITKIASGGFFHYIALKSDGTVWVWGKGLGSLPNSNVPVQVSGLSNVIDIAAGESHAIVLKSDSTVWTWGENFSGELGHGTFNGGLNTPTQVNGLNGIVAVYGNACNNGGMGSSYALKADGTLWAWGNNGSGQLGLGNYDNQNIPVQAVITNVKEIAVGHKHVVALKQDGTVWAWGHNFEGQVNGTLGMPHNTPIQITSVANALHVFRGKNHSYALGSDGKITAWGYNNDGLLGISTAPYNQPSIGIADQLCTMATSINNVEKTNTLNVYPNPNQGAFTIETSTPGNYQLMDISGRVIRNIHVNANTKVDINNLGKGIYILRSNNSVYQKVVVQ